MQKEQVKSFSARITQASQLGLVVITYEIILSYMESAKNFFDESNMVSFRDELKEAQKFLRDLQVNLDMKQVISKELMTLYIYCNKLLIEATFKKSAEQLEVVSAIITNLNVGFHTILKEDHSLPSMTNTEQIYAGLTYGKNALNETTLYSEQRGYKV